MNISLCVYLQLVIFINTLAMKKSVILSLALLACVPAIKAQSEYPLQQNRISVGYDAEFMNVKDGPNETFSGFAVQYTHEWKIAQNLPLYFGTGLKLNANFYSDNAEENVPGYGKIKYKESMTVMSFSVPLNVSYRVGLANGVTLQPYTGFGLKLNAIGKGSIEVGGQKEDINAFDKDDVGDANWKRFQIGWQIGAGVNVSKVYIGLEYGIDLMSLSSTVKTSHLGISLGYNF